MANNADKDEEPSDKYEAPVTLLRPKTKNLISLLLNPIKIIPTDKGLPRDWQGLAELVGISGEYMPQLKNEVDPTLKVLDWLERKENSSIRMLLNFLEVLDRYDVIDDVKDLIEEDIKLNFSKKDSVSMKESRVKLGCDKDILTFDDSKRLDQGLEPQSYDAFVLYANEDIEFATELIKTMEEQKNLKFCVKDRDLVGGAFEHEVIIRLISERCNRLVVIFSTAFFQSPVNKFFVNFATAIGIEDCSRKIVPCSYTRCDIPLELKYYHILDFRRAGVMFDFWDKLYESIQTPSKIPKKTNLSRSESHQTTLQERCQFPTPAFPNYTNNRSARPSREAVTFDCPNDAQENGKNVLSKSGSGSLSSTDSSESKKHKSKLGWLKKLLPKMRSHCQSKQKSAALAN